jgi:hypothetical protein
MTRKLIATCAGPSIRAAAHTQRGADQHGQDGQHAGGPGDPGRPAEQKHNRCDESDYGCDSRRIGAVMAATWRASTSAMRVSSI